MVTVVLPELVPRHWWESLLHNQTALFFKRVLLFEPGVVVTSVPFHLAAPEVGDADADAGLRGPDTRRRLWPHGQDRSARSRPTGVLKRVMLGRAFSSSRLEHTLLPKVLALPVFASDALSSVAYATGEILLVLSIATSAPQGYVIPIAVAVSLLMALVIVSYRQTVRAYPGGGGAYIVSKENLGQFPGLVAAAALLFDYMMTVVVSIVAGVFAIGSALPAANEHAVVLSIFFVAFVTLANLRGSKESGVLFAIPTYGFVLSIGVLLVSVSGSAWADAPPSTSRSSRSTTPRPTAARSASSCC